MERDPIGNDRRKAARERALGDRARCVRCGIAEFDVLLPVKRRLLEEHHIAGRAHDALAKWPLCRNCHWWVTERLREAGVSMEEQPNRIESAVQWMRALNIAAVMLAESRARCVALLEREEGTRNDHDGVPPEAA